MIYGGDGLARLPESSLHDEAARGRGKAVFVPFVLAGETIEASLTEQKPGFARARADSFIETSPRRIEPACQYFSRCGGCHYQHAAYEHQLEIKEEILRETLRRVAKLELASPIVVHPSPPWNYRNRSRLQLRTKPAFVLGYFKLASHELLAVEECPISSPLINHGIAALWQNGRAGKVPEGVREVEFFANADDTQLLIEVGCAREARRAAIREWAEGLRSSVPAVAGVVAFREPNPGDQRATAPEILVFDGEDHLTYQLAYQTTAAAYRVSAGAFFQTNRHLVGELVNIVTQGRSGNLALDLYAGVGLFSTALARDFRHIVSVEPSQTSSGDLSYNLPANGKAIRGTAEQYFEPAGKTERGAEKAALSQNTGTPDLVVVDPPRSGLEGRVTRALAGLGAPRVTYVSCDPATLARDLVPLLGAGYRVEQVHLVDLFPQTFHLESVVHLVR